MLPFRKYIRIISDNLTVVKHKIRYFNGFFLEVKTVFYDIYAELCKKAGEKPYSVRQLRHRLLRLPPQVLLRSRNFKRF